MVRYVDADEEYPQLLQPQGSYVRMAEDELDAQAEVTWPEIQRRAWELQEEDEQDA